MPTLIPSPAKIEAAGTKPKIIIEYIARVNSGDAALSIAVCFPAFSTDSVHRDPE